jgi:hypothetical protein
MEMPPLSQQVVKGHEPPQAILLLIPTRWPDGLSGLILPIELDDAGKPYYVEDSLVVKKILSADAVPVEWCTEEDKHPEVRLHSAEWIIPTILWLAEAITQSSIDAFVGAILERAKLRRADTCRLKAGFYEDGALSWFDYQGPPEEATEALRRAMTNGIPRK